MRKFISTDKCLAFKCRQGSFKKAWGSAAVPLLLRHADENVGQKRVLGSHGSRIVSRRRFLVLKYF